MSRDYYDGPSPLSELANVPHYPLGHVLLSNAELLRAAGLRYPADQLLGRGTFGAAFRVGDAVLKLTRDPTEVQAACLLKGRTSERIVRVHGVWYLRSTFAPGLQRWYIIHRALLHPLTALDKDLIEMLFALYDEESLDLVIPRSARQYATISKWRNYVRQELMGGEGTLTDDEGNVIAHAGSLATGKHVKRAMQLLVHIGAAVDEMHRAGIDWEDIHSDNWMRDAEGRLVIADVGFGLMHNDFEQTVLALTPEVVAKELAAASTAQATTAAP